MKDNNQQAVAIFDKLADVYQSKFMDVSMYASGLDFFCQSVKNENAVVLELACGPGNITRYVLNQRPKFRITATDMAPKMIALAQINNPDAIFNLMDCRDIDRLNQKFDAIICGFCLPYLDQSETQRLIKNIYAALNQSGILYLSAIKGNYENSGFQKASSGDTVFMHYYDTTAVAENLLHNGFSLLKTEEIVSKSADGTLVTDWAIVAKK